jgi:hypothetical protein
VAVRCAAVGSVSGENACTLGHGVSESTPPNRKHAAPPDPGSVQVRPPPTQPTGQHKTRPLMSMELWVAPWGAVVQPNGGASALQWAGDALQLTGQQERNADRTAGRLSSQ